MPDYILQFPIDFLSLNSCALFGQQQWQSYSIPQLIQQSTETVSLPLVFRWHCCICIVPTVCLLLPRPVVNVFPVVASTVAGCPDVDAANGAIVERRERDELVVRCPDSKETWYLTCGSDNRWIGEMFNCTTSKSRDNKIQLHIGGLAAIWSIL